MLSRRCSLIIVGGFVVAIMVGIAVCVALFIENEQKIESFGSSPTCNHTTYEACFADCSCVWCPLTTDYKEVCHPRHQYKEISCIKPIYILYNVNCAYELRSYSDESTIILVVMVVLIAAALFMAVVVRLIFDLTRDATIEPRP